MKVILRTEVEPKHSYHVIAKIGLKLWQSLTDEGH